MTPGPGFPGGTSKRRIARYGETVDLDNDVIATDESTDWNDQSVTTTTTTVDAIVQRSRVSGAMVRTEEGDEVEVDATVYVHDDDLGGFPIRDGGAGSPTVVTANSHEYIVVTDDLRPNGIHELEVSRV